MSPPHALQSDIKPRHVGCYSKRHLPPPLDSTERLQSAGRASQYVINPASDNTLGPWPTCMHPALQRQRPVHLTTERCKIEWGVGSSVSKLHMLSRASGFCPGNSVSPATISFVRWCGEEAIDVSCCHHVNSHHTIPSTSPIKELYSSTQDAEDLVRLVRR